MVKSKSIIVLGCLVLGACASTSGRVSNAVDAAVVSLTTAERLALVYTSLPRCPVQKPVCSDPSTVARIKDLDNKAYAAVKAAESNEALLSVAIAAVQSFQSSIPNSGS